MGCKEQGLRLLTLPGGCALLRRKCLKPIEVYYLEHIRQNFHHPELWRGRRHFSWLFFRLSLIFSPQKVSPVVGLVSSLRLRDKMKLRLEFD